MKKIICTPKAPAPIGPYSQAVESNNTLYVSGQIAINPETGLLDNEDITSETVRVINNLRAILTEAGYVPEEVVKCSIFFE